MNGIVRMPPSMLITAFVDRLDLHADDRVDDREHRREVVLHRRLSACRSRRSTAPVPPRTVAGTQPGSGFAFVAPLQMHVVAIEVAGEDAEARAAAVAERHVLVDRRVVHERELDREPAELSTARCVIGAEDVVGLVAAATLSPLLIHTPSPTLQVLVLEAELELEVAAATR